MIYESDKPLTLSVQAISIRQPWAWLITHGWKNIENRTWPTKHRGLVMIHAAKTMTRDEYDACKLFVSTFAPGLALMMPPMPEYQRGGIVGAAIIIDCVTSHTSEWFCGPYGFVLTDARPFAFRPCLGRLGFFCVPITV